MTLTIPNTFTAGTVIDPNQMNANFSAISDWIAANGRTGISTAMTVYVAPGGSDANSGLSPQSAKATVTGAWQMLSSLYAFVANVTVTILLAPGAYNENVVVGGTIPGQLNPGNVVILGNAGTPDSVTVTGNPCFRVNHGAKISLQGIHLLSPAGFGILGQHYAQVNYSAMDFGACASNQVQARDNAYVSAVGNYTVSGGAQAHARSWGSGSTIMISLQDHDPVTSIPGPTVTLTGTPAFTTGFIVAHACAVADVTQATFVGAATGPQYSVNDNAVILTGTGGTMTLPGNAAGVTANGGVYD